jgi:hypothetical protein
VFELHVNLVGKRIKLFFVSAAFINLAAIGNRSGNPINIGKFGGEAEENKTVD